MLSSEIVFSTPSEFSARLDHLLVFFSAWFILSYRHCLCLRHLSDTISIMITRPARLPEEGAMSGRFLDLSEVLPGPLSSAPGWPDSVDSLFVEPASDVFPDFLIADECKHPLSYAPLPGPSVIFLKVSDRSPSKECLQQVIRRLAPWSIESVPMEDRKSLLERAREEAISVTEPVTRLVPVVLCGDTGFIQLRTVDSRIFEWLGRWWKAGISLDPKVWSPSSPDPNSMLLSLLEAQILYDSDGGSRKDMEVTVESVSISVGKAKMRGPVRKNHRAIDAFLRIPSQSGPTIDSIELSVRVSNGTVKLYVDDGGLWKADLPSCRGGFSKDRMIRRFKDLNLATSIVKKELLESASLSAG